MWVDFDKPWPDKGHEAIRVAILEHLDQLRDSFLIGETTADGLSIALSNFVTMQQQLTELTARVAALEAANPPLADAAGAVRLGGSATATSES